MRRSESGRGRRGYVPAVERCEGRLLLDAGTASLAGFVYCDVNNNGVKDPGEPAVAGAKMVLGGTDTGGVTLAFTATTDTAGAYRFPAVPAGTYSLTETPPAGSKLLAGKVTAGTPGSGTPGTRILSGIVLADGDAGQNNNFGEHQPTPKVKSDVALATARGANKVIVTFDQTLDATAAKTLSNYSLKVAVKTRKGVAYQPVKITGATLGSGGYVVTLTLARPINVFGTNVLTVNGRLNPGSLVTTFQGTVGVIPAGPGKVLTPRKV